MYIFVLIKEIHSRPIREYQINWGNLRKRYVHDAQAWKISPFWTLKNARVKVLFLMYIFIYLAL